jgi:predicted Zn-dependent protease
MIALGSWTIAGADTGDRTLQAMTDELNRSTQRLVLDDYDPPYFIAYRLTEIRSIDVRASYGALESSGGNAYRGVAVEVRVGDYVSDNTSDDEGFYYDPRDTDSYRYSRAYAPIDDDPAALRQDLWLLTDYNYKRALEEYIGKRGRSVQKVEEEDKPEDFTRATPVEHIEPLDSLTIDKKRWEGVLRVISGRFKAEPLIYESATSFKAISKTRYLVTTEGTQLRTTNFNYSLALSANARADDGMPISLERVFKAHAYENLPDSASLAAVADTLIDLVMALRGAPVMEPYTGPAIIKSGASGVFFHEALGHRLEGHRTRKEGEGHTFKSKVGMGIIPEFLDVIDDPTVTEVNGTELYGHYVYDDEGIASEPVTLVDHGVLKGFLMCRTPIKDQSQSNGHGRSDIWSSPVSRQGSLFIKAENPLTYKALRKRLLEECRRAGKEYGLIFEEMVSGETNTSSYGVQTLRVRPRVVRKVFVDDGREELVRGVELIGTPLSLLENIAAAADDMGVFNGVCGAESGWVPVSAIAPSILLPEVEVQKLDRNQKRSPILPPPLHDPNG